MDSPIFLLTDFIFNVIIYTISRKEFILKIVDRNNANFVILASDNFNKRSIYCKFFINLDEKDSLAGALSIFVSAYSNIIKPNIRIDIYRVRNGNIIGGGKY